MIRLRFSAYGKLPSSREFIWRNCDTPSATAFKGWLEGAAGILPAIKGVRQVDYVLHRCDGEGRIVGTLWPSTDAGGLRPYPFALFAVDDAAARGIALRTVWSKCAELHEGLRGAHDEHELFRELELLDDVSIEVSTATPFIPLQVWVDDVLQGDMDRMALALWRWRRAIESGDLAGASRRSVLRVPLSARIDTAEQADSILDSWPQDGLVLRGDEHYLHLIVGKAVPSDLVASSTSKGLRFQSLLDPTLPAQMEGFSEYLQHLRSGAAHPSLSLRFAALRDQFRP